MASSSSSSDTDSGNAAVDFYENLGRNPMNPYQQRVAATYPRDSSVDFLFNTRPFVNAYGEQTKRRAPTDSTLGSFGLVFRPNYNLRSRIHTRLRELHNKQESSNSSRSSNTIPFDFMDPGNECVAIHIRRGDRVLSTGTTDNVNMKEYCFLGRDNGTIGRDDCSAERLEKVDMYFEERGLPTADCGELLDYGCFDPHSFGELTLVDYLQKALAVTPSGVRHAIVLTDDEPWVKEQLPVLAETQQFADWKVGHLSTFSGSREGAYNGTQYSVDFWTAIAVARQCQTFVGHFSSGAAMLIYQAMCFHHGESTGDCPAGADIGSSDTS